RAPRRGLGREDGALARPGDALEARPAPSKARLRRVAKREAVAARVERAAEEARHLEALAVGSGRDQGEIAPARATGREGAAQLARGLPCPREEHDPGRLAVEAVDGREPRAAGEVAQRRLQREAAARASRLGGEPCGLVGG